MIKGSFQRVRKGWIYLINSFGIGRITWGMGGGGSRDWNARINDLNVKNRTKIPNSTFNIQTDIFFSLGKKYRRMHTMLKFAFLYLDTFMYLHGYFWRGIKESGIGICLWKGSKKDWVSGVGERLFTLWTRMTY